MVVSEITNEDVARVIKLDFDTLTEHEKSDITTLIGIAKKYIMNNTGLTLEQLDDHEDFIHVVYVLCQDMYDNVTMYVDKNNVNKVVDSILGMHAINLL